MTILSTVKDADEVPARALWVTIPLPVITVTIIIAIVFKFMAAVPVIRR